jgi:hypothetical protein
MITLASLADAEPWSQLQLAELNGNVRGALLRDWGLHVRRRRGPGAVERIREVTGITRAMLPDSPFQKAWYPCRFQISLTDAIVHEFLEGDYLALEELLLEDGQRARERIIRWVVSKIGPATVFKKAPAGHPDVTDVGRVTSTVQRRSATLTWQGDRLFDNSTWRLLQMMAARLMLRVMKKSEVQLSGEELGGGAFVMHVAWR